MAANPFISNGTCYFTTGLKADEDFIPCGNDAAGHKPCCQKGDKCVSSRACYNDKLGLTYLAGCSDPEYKDANCPEKPNLADSPWVGLVTCAGTNLWSACPQRGKPSTLKTPDACTCTRTAGAAFTDAIPLTDVARLPTALGESVFWLPGHLPTSMTSSPSSKTTTSPSVTSSSTPTVTAPPTTLPSSSPPPSSSSSAAPTAEPQVSSSNGMSTGAKAGLGAGVALAAVLIISAAIAFVFFRRRNRNRQSNAAIHNHEETHDHVHAPEPKFAWSPATVATSTVSELDSRAARPWSELEGSNTSPRPVGPGFEDNIAPTPPPKGAPQGLGLFAELQG
ncbi:hypothetical protein GE09DRAFT_506304 [Coniochaeta sp. 2T2.1]|nr:hypothetical protein GE09DRAFT_506304 [Coniochaeta sp. 2T2.1]